MGEGNWPAQTRQNERKFELVVDGSQDWKPFFDGTTKFNEAGDSFWIKRCGGVEVPLLRYLEVEAEINNVSLERCLMNTLLRRGFELQELEVEFTGEQAKWGVCTWYKEHPRYTEPLGKGFKPEAQKWVNFIRAMWKTEHAGDQQFGLFSTQMAGAALLGMPVNILLHKTLLYRRAVFTSPKKEAKTD